MRQVARLSALCLNLIVVNLGAVLSAAANSDCDPVFEAIETSLDSDAFRINFEQKTENLLLGETIIRDGVVLVELPGKLRWEFTDGEPNTLVMDQNFVWFQESARTVRRGSAKGSSYQALLSLLSGDRRALQSDFTLLCKTTEGDHIEATLKPAVAFDTVKELRVTVDAKKNRLEAIVIADHSDQETEITIKRVRSVKGHPEETFIFRPDPLQTRILTFDGAPVTDYNPGTFSGVDISEETAAAQQQVRDDASATPPPEPTEPPPTAP